MNPPPRSPLLKHLGPQAVVIIKTETEQTTAIKTVQSTVRETVTVIPSVKSSVASSTGVSSSTTLVTSVWFFAPSFIRSRQTMHSTVASWVHVRLTSWIDDTNYQWPRYNRSDAANHPNRYRWRNSTNRGRHTNPNSHQRRSTCRTRTQWKEATRYRSSRRNRHRCRCCSGNYRRIALDLVHEAQEAERRERLFIQLATRKLFGNEGRHSYRNSLCARPGSMGGWTGVQEEEHFDASRPTLEPIRQRSVQRPKQEP